MEISKRKWNCRVKKRSVILCGIVYILMLSVGCSSNKQVAEEMMKQERFQGVEEVATDQQINMYFAQMVKDLRTGYETSQTQAVFDGDIDAFIESGIR